MNVMDAPNAGAGAHHSEDVLISAIRNAGNLRVSEFFTERQMCGTCLGLYGAFLRSNAVGVAINVYYITAWPAAAANATIVAWWNALLGAGNAW